MSSASRRLRVCAGASFALASAALTGTALAVDATWLGPLGGNWNMPAQWSGGVVPNNAPGVIYHAFIDGGQPADVQVRVPQGTFAIGTLTISAGDRLTLTPFSSLGLTGSAATGTSTELDNAGLIRLWAGAGPAQLRASALHWHIRGGGTILLEGGILSGNPAGSVTNFDNVIAGYGFIGAGRTRFVNLGTIRAGAPGTSLTIEPTNVPDGFTNVGTLQARGGGILLLRGSNGGGFVNSGLIEAMDGALARAPTDAFVNTGTIRAASGGWIDLVGANLGSFDSTAGAVQVLQGGSLSTTFAVVNCGSIQLDGTWHANGGTIAAGAVAGAGTLSHTAGRTTVRHVRVPAVSISGGRLSMLPGGGVAGTSRVESLSITGPAQINLADHDLVIDFSDTDCVGTVRGYLRSGFNGGAWDGPGIVTDSGDANRRGIAYARAADVFTSFPALFSGQMVDATSVLLRFSRFGDADLDGLVTLHDFNRLAANFGATDAIWSEGDFNYDGIVDLRDFNLLARNFGVGSRGPELTPLDWAALASAIPETGPGVVAGLAILALRRRARARGAGAA